tara:strand:+ start:376 stop:789 length:414 start_codon:yes stop_codon:yes gene_type:complete
MPYEAKKQKCKKKDGSSGTHAIYKKGTSEKVGCTSDPKKYMSALYSVEENTMPVSRERLQEIIKEELTTFLNEEWKGDPEIKQTGEYADKTKAELCKMRDDLKKKEKRTAAQSTELRQINFALRSKQPGKKFGKVDC